MRDKSIDCMKGLGIIIVVLVHAGFPQEQYLKLFHMSVFFIFSGYFHRETYSENMHSIFSFFKKRLKSLYIPYILFNFVLLCFHNIFYNWNIYTDNPLFLQSDIAANSYGLIGSYSVQDYIFQFILTIGFVGGEQLAGTLWFLRALFEVEILYVVIDWISRKFHGNRKYFHCIVTIGILLIGYLLNTKNIHIVTGVETTCYYYIFFVIGILLQRTNLWRTFPNKFMLPLSAVWLLANGFLVTHSFINNRYFPPFYVMNGIMGGILLKSIADILMKNRISRFFEYSGKHSMAVMLWHFPAYKLVSFVYIKIHDLPEYFLASFPYLRVPYLWIVYTIIGTALPLLAVYVLEIAENKYHAS